MMPIKPGEYAQALRSLGQVLEMEHAEEITITFEEDFMSGSWLGQAKSDDAKIERQLNILHEQSKMVRVKPGQLAKEGLAEILRTLGQDLDEQQVEVLRVVEEGDRWVVTIAGQAGPVEREYLTQDLLTKSREQSEFRRERAAMSSDPPEVPPLGLQARTGPIGRRILRRDITS